MGLNRSGMMLVHSSGLTGVDADEDVVLGNRRCALHMKCLKCGV